MGVHLPVATHQGGPGTNWTSAPACFWASLGAPPACFCRWIRWFPPLNPAPSQENVASCDSLGYGRCSWSSRRGEVGRGTGAPGLGTGPDGPHLYCWLKFFQGLAKALKLGWRAMVQLPGLGGNFFSTASGWKWLQRSSKQGVGVSQNL